MRSMQWQLGILGTISAFAYRHRETKKNLCRGGRSQEVSLLKTLHVLFFSGSTTFRDFRTFQSNSAVFLCTFQDELKGKGKAVSLQVQSDPEVSRKLRFPDYMITAQGGGKVVSLTHRSFLPPGNTPGTHFCWRLSRPQCHSAIGRIISMKNSNDTIWNRTSDLLICSTVP